MTALLPWVFFLLASCFVLAEVHRSAQVVLVVEALVGFCCLLAAAFYWRAGRRDEPYTFFLCAVAVAVSTVTAGYVYARNFREYDFYRDHRQYTNVWPSESAAA